MNRSTRRCLLLVIVALTSLLAIGCKRSNAVLATLEAGSGTVERDYAGRASQWESATVSATFEVGDGLRTGTHSSARLRLSDKSAVKLDDNTLIRFLAKPPGANAQGLQVQAGQAELEVSGVALRLDTGSGIVQVQPGSRLRLSSTSVGTRFSVLIGSARLDGATSELHAGDAIEVGIGRAIIDPAPPAAAAARLPAPSPSGSQGATDPAQVKPDDAGAEAAEEKRSRGPQVVDLTAAAGESLLIHDPHPPTAIAFAMPDCTRLALLRLGGTHKFETVGTGGVHGSFPAGVNRYKLFCLGEDKARAEGTISVVRDAGSRSLSGTAPATRVDTDGRRYTVLYQNLLPQMFVHWPEAPPNGPFTLSVRSARGTQQFSAASPDYSFAPGALSEGSHELWFAAPVGRSKSTTVVIQFDNAAPTANITSPANGSFASGSAVQVAGTALPGWTVSVAGQEIPQDAQHRFSGQAQAAAGQRALVIRFAHPQRGAHSYLRRSSE